MAAQNPDQRRTIPETWDSSPLPGTGHEPIDFDAKDGYFPNTFSADQINSISQYAFERSHYLFELAEQRDAITLTSDEIRTLADSFEEIGFQLGDGVLFEPKQPETFSQASVRRFLRRFARHHIQPET